MPGLNLMSAQDVWKAQDVWHFPAQQRCEDHRAHAQAAHLLLILSLKTVNVSKSFKALFKTFQDFVESLTAMHIFCACSINTFNCFLHFKLIPVYSDILKVYKIQHPKVAIELTMCQANVLHFLFCKVFILYRPGKLGSRILKSIS